MAVKKTLHNYSGIIKELQAGDSIDGGGGGGGGLGAYGRAYRITAFDIPNANTWNSVPLNGGNADLLNVTHSTSTNPERIYVSSSGKYYIKASCAVAGGAVAALGARLIKNYESSSGIISQGKSYTVSPTPVSGYPDTGGIELTDGNTGTTNSWTPCVGWDTGSPTITINLGNLFYVDKFCFYCKEWTAAGIYKPSNVQVLYSTDGSTFTSLGNITTFGDTGYPSDIVYRTYRGILTTSYVSARHIRFIVTRGGSMVMVQEAEVYPSESVTQSEITGSYRQLSVANDGLQRIIDTDGITSLNANDYVSLQVGTTNSYSNEVNISSVTPSPEAFITASLMVMKIG